LKKPHILFVSTMGGSPWGGSEELWSKTAIDLAERDFSVAASFLQWQSPDKHALDLANRGIDVAFRSRHYVPLKGALRKFLGQDLLALDVEKLVARRTPALVVLSDGGPYPPVALLELCVVRRLPFVTIGQANFEGWWPTDDVAERYRMALPKALRCFFVSRANYRLVARQIGSELPNVEVIWNPFNVAFDVSLPFPFYSDEQGLLLACVGRLHPPSKGQDILLEALASPAWISRNWRLRFYGEGEMRDSLDRMSRQLGISNRVVFAGHRSVEEIWTENQVLVMPSRYEGLPLAIVEALLCGRTVVATDVAGNSEVISNDVGFLAKAPTVPALLEALERLWVKRMQVEEIGRAAAMRIRKVVPSDPIEVFSRRLRQLAGLEQHPEQCGLAKTITGGHNGY
jgi:glycosyltransferase involved in cell wall biosynthesis